MSVNPTSGDSKRSSSRMKQAQSNKTIRLRHLNIQNFKAFDKLEIDLPPPLMEDDSDIFIMGSKNGLGKTSFLEACFMLFLAGLTETNEFSFSHYVDFDLRRYVDMPIDFPDLMVRAGASEAIIEGSFAIRDKNANVIFSLQRDGTVKVKYPMHECRGFYAGCPTLASSRPVFVATSVEGSDPLSTSTIGTQTLVR